MGTVASAHATVDAVTVAERDGTLRCLDPSTGEERWMQESEDGLWLDDGHPQTPDVTHDPGGVYAFRHGFVESRDLATGALRWKRPSGQPRKYTNGLLLTGPLIIAETSFLRDGTEIEKPRRPYFSVHDHDQIYVSRRPTMFCLDGLAVWRTGGLDFEP
jgi:outer membrane protein assembly factor BamB